MKIIGAVIVLIVLGVAIASYLPKKANVKTNAAPVTATTITPKPLTAEQQKGVENFVKQMKDYYQKGGK